MTGTVDDEIKATDLMKKIDEILKLRYPNPSEFVEFQQPPQSTNVGFPLCEKLKSLDKMAWTEQMRCIEFNPDCATQISDLLDKDHNIKNSINILSDIKNVLNKVPNTDQTISINEKMGDVYKLHLINCMEGIRYITNSKPNFTDFFERYEEGIGPYKKFVDLVSGLQEGTKIFLRFIALYHDVGKSMHRDKHPTLGKHILESLDDKDKKSFLKIFDIDSQSEKVFYSMLDIIGHHDLFGVLCTGEASKTAFIEASGLWLRSNENAKKIILYIAILNLADMYGTIGPIPIDRITYIMDDWEYINKMLDSNKNSNIIDSYSKAQIENKILESQQEPIETLERLRRFITCGIISSKNYDILKELNRKHLCGMITHELLRSTLMKKLGPDLKKFCSDFALICKLDYTLKFAKSLCDAWIKKNNLNSNNIQDAPIVFLINIFLDILIRLVHCYNDLTYNNEGGRQRIGLELLGLNRSTELSERIIDLLLSDRISEGINWIASETTAWYY